MLLSEVIVETVEVAFSRPHACPVISYDKAVSVSFTEKVRCAIFFLCPLHNNAVMGILYELC